MPIFDGNPALLIAAPMLQDLLVDENGIPLAAGIVTMAFDNDHNKLKNWYYKTGPSGGPYQFITLANPLTLSGAGTITDPNGNDTIPYYYPYASDNVTYEPYFVTVQNSALQIIFTRDGFPFISTGSSVITNGATNENYILNNRFWRNFGSASVSSLANSFTTAYNTTGTYYYATLAPSQHDGFSMPDYNYIRNTNGGDTEQISFSAFPLSTNPSFVNDIRPEFFVTHQLAVNGSGATLRVHQFPICLHIDNLGGITGGQKFTFTIQAMANSGNPNLNIFIYQFLGTNETSPAPFSVGTITLTNTWEKYTLTGTLPALASQSLGVGGDDAYYLQIAVPTIGVYSLSFAIPSIYLGTNIAINNFQTYDQIDTIINSPRTGDIRTSLNSFTPFGWVPLNNGTIGGENSHATTRAFVDTWPLFNLLWTSFKAYDQAGVNPICQMYTSGGGLTAYGTSAINDFGANKALGLTQTLGQVILGGAPAFTLPTTFKTTFTGSGTTITPNNTINTYNGAPITFSGTTTLTVGVIYFVGNYSGTTFSVYATFNDAITQTSPISVDASGTFTFAIAGFKTGEYAHLQLLTEIASHTHNPISPSTGFWDNLGGHDVALGGAGFTAFSDATTGGITRTTPTSYLPANVTQPSMYMNMFIKL